MRAAAILVLSGVALAAGCGLLKPVDVEVNKETLTQVPTGLPQAATRAATLLVLAPSTNAVYDTTQMAYATKPNEIAYFGVNEWGETPAQMIQPLVVKTLEQSRYFSAVLSPPYMGRYNYALRTEIRELKQDFTSEPPALHLELRFQLTNADGNRVIATKEVRLREPMREKSPQAGVAAANTAVASALRQLAAFVLEKTG